MRAYALTAERLNVHDKHALDSRHQFLCEHDLLVQGE
jgi:hypothetical protein